jgi:hypothetical protein
VEEAEVIVKVGEGKGEDRAKSERKENARGGGER